MGWEASSQAGGDENNSDADTRLDNNLSRNLIPVYDLESPLSYHGSHTDIHEKALRVSIAALVLAFFEV